MARYPRHSEPQALSRLMALEEDAGRAWTPQELGQILRHQLAAPVEFDLSTLNAGLAAKLRTLATSEGLVLRSFRDLFFHPRPPVELLILTKDFAKATHTHPRSELPPEIATFLYFGSIVVALLRCNRRISQLSDVDLITGMEWLKGQPWIEQDVRDLFQEGIDHLHATGGGSV